MTATEGKRPLRSTVLTVVAIALVLLSGAALYVAIRLYPWLKGPSDSEAVIAARWAKVESWAQVQATPADTAKSELEAIAGSLQGFQRPSGGGEVPVVELTTLTPAERLALERFERWEQSGAPLLDRSCALDVPPGGASLHLLKVGQAALFTAKDAEQLPRVRAVLVLAQRLRQRGSLVDLVIGSELAVKCAAWSDRRSVPLPQELLAFRPRVDEIHGALARNAVCMLDRLGQSAQGGGRRLDVPGPPFGIVRLERERLVYKAFQGRLLEQLHSKKDDWSEMVRLCEEADSYRPKSAVIDIARINPGIIRSSGEKMDRFRSLTSP